MLIDCIFEETEEDRLVKFFNYICEDEVKKFKDVASRIKDRNAYIIGLYYSMDYVVDKRIVDILQQCSYKTDGQRIKPVDIYCSARWLYDRRHYLSGVYDRKYEFLICMSPCLGDSPPISPSILL